MEESIQQIQNRIAQDYKQGRLVMPSLPDVALRLQTAVRDERLNASQLGKLVQMDSALSSRLIQVSNSPRYRGSSAVDNCKDAITRLGLEATANLATGLAMRNAFHSQHESLNRWAEKIWEQSCRLAAIAHVIAHVSPGFKTHRAMLCGLIFNIGALPLLRYLEDYPELLDEPHQIQDSIERLNGQLGTLLLTRWKFDAEMASIPLYARDWDYDGGNKADYVDVVLVARAHSRFGNMDKDEADYPPPHQLTAFQKLPMARFGPEASIQLIESADEEIATLTAMLRGEL